MPRSNPQLARLDRILRLLGSVHHAAMLNTNTFTFGFGLGYDNKVDTFEAAKNRRAPKKFGLI